MIIYDLVLFIIVFVACIVLHEIGHLIYIKKYGGKAELTFNNKDLETSIPYWVTDKGKKRIILAGILLGVLPMGLLISRPIFLLICLVLYGIGCKHDLKMLKNLDD